MAEREDLVYSISVEGVDESVSELEKFSKAKLRNDRRLLQSQLKLAQAQAKTLKQSFADRTDLKVKDIGKSQSNEAKAYRQLVKDIDLYKKKITELKTISLKASPKAQAMKFASVQNLSTVLQKYANQQQIYSKQYNQLNKNQPPAPQPNQQNNNNNPPLTLNALPNNAQLISTIERIKKNTIEVVETWQALGQNGEIQLFTKIGNSITRIKTGLENVDTNGLYNGISSTNNEAKKTISFLHGAERVSETWSETVNGIKRTYTSVDGVIKKIKEEQEKIPVALPVKQKNITDANGVPTAMPKNATLVNSVAKLRNGVQEVVETWQSIGKDGSVDTFTKVGDNITKVGSKTRKVTSGFDKFKQKFKGVFFYRVIRGMIQALEQALKHLIQFAMEGVKIFAKFDKATKKAYSTITSSFTMLKGSLGSLFAPITEAIAPAINSIAKSFADFTNSIRQAKAQMQGLSKYTKINTDYYKEFKELQNQGQFKFDTFNTLSNAPEESGLFEQASVNEDIDVGQIEYLKNTILGFSDSLGGLWEIIQGVANSFMPLIRPIIDLVLIAVSVIMDALSITFETLKPILDTVFGAIEEIWIELQPFVLYLGEMFTKAFEVVGAIIDQIWIMIEPVIIWIKDACKIVANLLSGDIAGAFSSLGDLVMNIFIGIANFLIGTINLVSTFINYAIEGVMKAVGNIVNPIMEFVDKTSKFFGGDGVSWRMDTEGWKIPMIQKIEYKADGGTVSAGTMFIAGESGTEMVWNNSSGGSSVANIEQIRQAQYESMMQAIYDSGLLVTIENSGVHDIYMDSEKVGNSIGKTKSLRTQLNRTNLGLGLK